jgi:hypothetical protein
MYSAYKQGINPICALLNIEKTILYQRTRHATRRDEGTKVRLDLTKPLEVIFADHIPFPGKWHALHAEA